MSAAEVAGVDFSATKPDPAALVRAGFRFVIGYLKPLGPTGPNPKELTAAQVRGYRAAGLAVLAVWETTTDRAVTGGGVGGLADGRAARARAVAIGYPTTAVIFAACDQDVSSGQAAAAVEYLAGFAQGVGPHPAGAYGSATLVESVHARTSALWLWQTAAWSGGRLSPVAHLYQRATPSGHWPIIPGTDEDVLCAPVPWYANTPRPVPPTPAATLPAGGVLSPGQALRSGAYRLVMQGDGNAVVYTADGRAVWSTRTNGHPGAVLKMQGDGNAVVYSPDGRALWSSGTSGDGGGCRLSMQADGNLVIYRPDNRPVWSIR